jgi:MFS family permease
LDDFQSSNLGALIPSRWHRKKAQDRPFVWSSESEIYLSVPIPPLRDALTMSAAEAVTKGRVGASAANSYSSMYLNQVGVAAGRGMADPYVSYLALGLGADAAQLGWLQAFINLFPAVMQVPWGKLSDFFGRRVPFLVVGGVLSFALYFFMVGAIDAQMLIILVAIQMFIGSMMIPTWSAFVGDMTTVKNRGRVMSKFFVVASFANLIGTLFAGLVIPADVSEPVFHRFALPFFLAGLSGMVGSLILLEIKEAKRRLYASPRTIFEFGLKSFIFTSDLKENVYFRNLVLLNTTFNFIMSLIWPIMMLTYVEVLHATALEIGIMAVISTGGTLFFQTKVGKLLDVIGPMPQILISRFAFISVPVVYALATHVWQIYLMNAALGFANAMANVAFFAYILDVAPEEKKAEYFAVYNTIIGIATFFGSIIGGYLAYFFLNQYGGDWIFGLGAVYAISAFGRTACAMWFFKLKDPVKYSDTLSGVIKKTLVRWKRNLRSAF